MRIRVAYGRLRVLFVNHTGEFSGAEVAMIRLLRSLRGQVQAAVACPPHGPLTAELVSEGLEVLPIPGTALSFRLNPRTTATGLRGLARSATTLRRHARAWGADVLHANGTRAGLVSAATGGRTGPGVLVQVHDILPPGLAGDLVRRVLTWRADRIVAVSDAAAAAFNGPGRSGPAQTTYIAIDHERFHPNGRDSAAVRRSLGVPEGVPLVGVVAQITPWKGQLAAIEAVARVREDHPDVHLVLAGSVAFSGPQVRYDNDAYARELHARVEELGLAGAVHFAGHRRDVPDVMAALDLFLLPSWNEPFGTAIAEAMATGTVPIVTDEGGPREFVEDGLSGRLLPPREPAAWADAIVELLDHPERREAMARRAIEAVGRFTVDSYRDAMLAHYEAVAHR